MYRNYKNRYNPNEYTVRYVFLDCQEMHKFIAYCEKYDLYYNGLSYWCKGKEWKVWFTFDDFFMVKKLERLKKVFDMKH